MPGVDEALCGLWEGPRPPSAVFALTNQLALSTLYALKARGLRFPEDISLVSFDDPDWAPLFSPPLTTVRQPAYQLGISTWPRSFMTALARPRASNSR